jgi:hypothetical protein
MSKPFYPVFACSGHAKAKIRHSQRRKESSNKKKERIRNSEKLGWFYRYRLKTKRRGTRHKKVLVPEKREPWGHYETFYAPAFDDDGRIVIGEDSRPVYEKRIRFVTDYEEIIPEHIEIRKCGRYDIPIKPYLIQFHINKKWSRRQAAKRIRNSRELYQRGQYKRKYDLWDDVW